jgi:hypothetical protein
MGHLIPSELACLRLAELQGGLGASGPDYCGSELSEWGRWLSDHRMLSTQVTRENYWMALHFHFYHGLSVP